MNSKLLISFPMTKLVFLFCLFLLPLSHAAEVVKVLKNKVNIVIGDDIGHSWEVGEKICVQTKKGQNYCGEISKVMPRGALCKMRSPAVGIAPGDEVSLEVSSESLDSALDAEKSDLGDGKLDPMREESPSEQEQKKIRKKRKFAFGFEGGLVLSNVSSSPSTDTKGRKAVRFGLIFDVPLGRGLASMEPGLAFVQKGYETQTVAYGFNYFEIPLLLKIRMIAGRSTPVIFLGPYSSFLISAKTNSIAGEQNVKEFYKTVDFGVTGGMGYEFRVAPKMDFGFRVVYSQSLADIKQIASSEKLKHRGIQTLLYVAFQ